MLAELDVLDCTHANLKLALHASTDIRAFLAVCCLQEKTGSEMRVHQKFKENERMLLSANTTWMLAALCVLAQAS